MAQRGRFAALCLLALAASALGAVQAASSSDGGESGPQCAGWTVASPSLPAGKPAPSATVAPKYNVQRPLKPATAPAACPSACPSLPAAQRRASGLAVSLVAFIGCDGNVEGAARAIMSAAASGDTAAFSAGLAAGAATLTGALRLLLRPAAGCAQLLLDAPAAACRRGCSRQPPRASDQQQHLTFTYRTLTQRSHAQARTTQRARWQRR